ncbi:MAG: hypothetical protein HUU55_13705 [Myxococcales bacterium]|nr:hypothetical protein [Myxococcales bacterium]
MAKKPIWGVVWVLALAMVACGEDGESSGVSVDGENPDSVGADGQPTTEDTIVSQADAGSTGDDVQIPSGIDSAGIADIGEVSECEETCGFGERCNDGTCEPTTVLFARISHTKKVGLTGTAYAGEAFACTLQPNPKGEGTQLILLEKDGCKATVVRAGTSSANPSHVPVALSSGGVVFSGLSVPRIQLFPGETLESACVKQDLPGEAGPFVSGGTVTMDFQLLPDLQDNVTRSFPSPKPVTPTFGELIWGESLTVMWDAQGADFMVVGFSAADPVSQDTGLVLCTFPDNGRATVPGVFMEYLPIGATTVNSTITRYWSHHDEPEGFNSVVEIQAFTQHQQVLSQKPK